MSDFSIEDAQGSGWPAAGGHGTQETFTAMQEGQEKEDREEDSEDGEEEQGDSGGEENVVSERYLNWSLVNTMWASQAAQCSTTAEYLIGEAGKLWARRGSVFSTKAEDIAVYLRDTLVPYFKKEEERYRTLQRENMQKRPPEKGV